MTTDKPTDANRQNAQKKDLKREFAIRLAQHGEGEEEFRALLDFYETEYKPSTPTEEALITDLVTAAWRLRRLSRIEAYVNADMQKTRHNLDPFSDPWGLVAHPYEKALITITRQKARLERSFNRALRELQRSRTKRSAAPRRKQRPQPVKQVAVLAFPIMTNIPTS